MDTQKPSDSQEEYSSLSYLQSQIPLFLQRERDLRTTRRQNDRVMVRLLSLQKLGTISTIASEVTEGLRLALDILVSEISFEKAAVVLKRGEEFLVAAQSGYSKEEGERVLSLPSDVLFTLLHQVDEAKAALFINAEAGVSSYAAFGKAFNLGTYLLAPLGHGHIDGFIIAGFAKEDSVRYEAYRETLNFSESDTSWFGALSSQIASMIANIELITNLTHKTGELEALNKVLSEEHARLLASINSLPLGFILADINSDIMLSNKPVNTLLNLSASPRSLSDIDRVIGEKFSLKAQYRRCIEDMQMVNIPEVVFGKKFLHFYLVPVIMTRSAKRVIGAAVLIEDITEEKALERGKDEFFSIASHELRTPLTVIRGNVLLLRDYYVSKMKNAEAEQMIGDVLASTERLIRIVNDFLEVSSIEQKKIQLKRVQFDVSGLIEEVLREFQKLTDEKGISLTFTKDATLVPQVLADKDRTGQVLFNLIGNALKHTSKGSITISTEANVKYVKIYIQDTGMGIPPEQQSLLFRKFQQAGKDIIARDFSQGTGLGLYISKLLVEAMGGVIALEESKPEKGSVFSFTLPIA